VFESLAEEAYFAQATRKDGVVAWPNGVDIAPDAMSEEVSGKTVGIAVKLSARTFHCIHSMWRGKACLACQHLEFST